jgi:hypothetical protein
VVAHGSTVRSGRGIAPALPGVAPWFSSVLTARRTVWGDQLPGYVQIR